MARLTLKEYYICYIDVMGYQQLLKEHGAPQFLAVINEAYRSTLLDLEIMTCPVDYRLFSDNLIFCVASDEDGAFLEVLKTAETIQNNLVQRNIFIRGSITRGELYIDENYVFGDGLTRAYSLENNIAFYPRIIIDRQLDDKLMDLYDWYEYDADGYYYTDCLHAFLGDIFNRNDLNERELARSVHYRGIISLHQTLVKDNLERYTEDRIHQKYQWCRQYHNMACERFGFADLIIEQPEVGSRATRQS